MLQNIAIIYLNASQSHTNYDLTQYFQFFGLI